MMPLEIDNQRASGTVFAAVDIGSYTARLLIAEKTDSPQGFRALHRRREYTKLAEGFKEGEGGEISENAIVRLLSILADFKVACKEWNVSEVRSVATGVMRRAENKEQVIQRATDGWGIHISIITGDEEARLTGLGVMHALTLDHASLVIFDLGGGSTEFIYGDGSAMRVLSIPLGTAVFSQQYTPFAPPGSEAVCQLKANAGSLLHHALFPPNRSLERPWTLMGTGGTVTSLAAMLHGIDTRHIRPSLINGLEIDIKKLSSLIDRMKEMTLEGLTALQGLDRDRAPVILAGAVIVESILHFFKCPRLVACQSDILEGIMIDFVT